jgi:hypothetical protein
MITQKSQTTSDAGEEQCWRTARDQAPAANEKERLQSLVGELLRENQTLRFKVAQLEQQAESAERGLADATKWAGMVL